MDPQALQAFLLAPVAVIVAAFTLRGLDDLDQRYALRALAAHAVGSIAFWALSLSAYRGMDIFGYQKMGILLANLLTDDFVTFAPELVKYGLQLADPHIPIPYQLSPGTAGSLDAITGFMMFVTGPSLIGICLAASLAAWVGQICIYRVAREELPDDNRGIIAGAVLFAPSTLFWCSGLTKEAVAIAFFGVLVLSTYRFLKTRAASRVVGIVFGSVGVAMLKPYILVGFIIALTAAVYGDRAWRGAATIRVRPGPLVLAIAVGLGGFFVMGKLFPDLAATQVAQTLADRQQVWKDLGDLGGSAAEIGGGEARSPIQQLVFVPIALVNVLFRPVLFEVKNGPMILAALENTFLMVGAWSLFTGGRARVTVQTILRTPFLLFSAVFILVFGTGVGLATSNLGSVSRYRVPMMPFYVSALLILRAREEQRALRLSRPVRLGGGVSPSAPPLPPLRRFK